MTSENIILHIGYPKAASSWLQMNVFRAEFGFQNPWPTKENAALEYFVFPATPAFDAAAVRQKFLDDRREGARTTVLSHEALVGDPIAGRYHGFETAARLAASFPEAKIIIFFRAQESYAYSAWAEHVRRGATTDINAFLGGQDVPPGYRPFCPSDFLRFDIMISYYNDLFLQGNVLALPIEAVPSGEALKHLAVFLNNPALLNCDITPAYRGLLGGTIRFLRQMNKFALYDPTQRRSRKFVMTKARRLDRLLPKSIHEKCRRADQIKINNILKGTFKKNNQRLQSLTPVNLLNLGYRL